MALYKILFCWLACIAVAMAEISVQPEQFSFSAQLSAGTQSLQQVELPYQILAGLQRQDYGDLRVFNSQNQPIPFTIIVSDQVARLAQSVNAESADYWQTVSLQAGEQQNEWLFSTDSFAPLAKIRFDIPAVGLVYQGALYSTDNLNPVIQVENWPEYGHQHLKQEIKKILHRPYYRFPPQTVWQYQTGFNQYRLLTASGESISPALDLNANRAKYWKILLNQPLNLLPEQVPQIKFTWYTVKVIFLAQGQSPYRLAFGNPSIQPLLASFPYSLKDSAPEQVNIIHIQAISKTLSNKPGTDAESGINVQKILLWSLLCIGVLVMALMAYKLYQQMTRAELS